MRMDGELGSILRIYRDYVSQFDQHCVLYQLLWAGCDIIPPEMHQSIDQSLESADIFLICRFKKKNPFFFAIS